MGKKLAVLIGVVFLALYAGYYFGVRRYEPAEQLASNRWHAWAKAIFKKADAQTAEQYKNGGLPFREAARAHQSALVELEANRYAVDHGVRNCPDNYRADAQGISMDLEPCPTGQGILLCLPDEYRECAYSVKLYAYSPDRQRKVEVVAQPVIKIVRDDGFSVATHLSSGKWKLRGDTVFIVGGDAHNVEIRLQP